MFDDENEWEDNMEDLSILLQKYKELKDGKLSPYLFSFEDFETLVDYLSEEGAYKKGLEVLDLALDIYPNSVELLILKADILLACDRKKEALGVTRQAKNLEDKNLELISLEVELLCALDKEDEAIYLLSKMVEKEEDKMIKNFLLHEIVTVQTLKEEYEDAYETLMEILSNDSQNEEALHRISFIAAKADKSKESIKYHRTLLEDRPLDDLLWFNLADAYMHHNMLDEAEEAYNIVLGLSPRSDAAYLGLTECYIQQEKYDKAIDHIDEYHENRFPDYFMLTTLAKCYEKKQQFSKARQIYMSFMEHFDFVMEVTTYINIAKTFVAEENWKDALKNINLALSYDKTDAEIYELLAVTNHALDENEAALIAIKKAMDLDPANISHALVYIDISLELEDYNEIYSLLEEMEEMDIIDARLSYMKAITLMLEKRLQEAEVALTEGLELNPEYSSLMYDYIPSFENYTHLNSLISLYNK